MTLKDTHPTFQESIQDLSNRCGKSPEAIYTLWQKYSRQCQSADQSPILGEFEDWYRKELFTTPQRIPVQFREEECGGVFDGVSVTSDADPGL